VNALAQASEDAFLGLLDAFIAHTETHFAQESRWMRECGFPALHCHEAEHEGVLGVMRDVRGYVEQGKVHVGHVLVAELPEYQPFALPSTSSKRSTTIRRAKRSA
jgi:hemerythrin